jgi:magnesium-transporting ATPase (P-type)
MANGLATYMKKYQTQLQKDINNTQLDIDNIIGPTRTDIRRMAYETSESAHLLWIRKIFVLVYYLILLVYLFTSSFFPDKKYLKWKIWLYILLYILYPFLIDFLSRTIFDLYQEIDYIVNNKLPRNVYI